MLFQITELGGKVIFGTVIIVVGMFLARILANLVGSSTGEGGYAQTIVKYAIIALFTAIGLTFMGLADQIVMMAFGLILGSAAVATALAFGLGGRDAAARMLERWQTTSAARPRRRRRRRRSRSARPADDSPAAAGVSERFARLRRDRLVGREGQAAQGHRDRRGARRRRARGWSVRAMSGRAKRCSTGCSKRAAKEPTLFGFDFSFAPPIVERGEYLLGEPGVPKTAREFWAYVDGTCDDEDLGAASFLEVAHRRHFYFGIADGVKADFVRFRQCDARLNAQGGRKTASAYDAIGAAQVAKASFSGCGCSTGSTARSRSGRWTRCPTAAARSSKSTPASICAAQE